MKAAGEKTKSRTARILYWMGRDIRSIVFWIAVLANSFFVVQCSGIMKEGAKCDLTAGLFSAYSAGMAAHIIPITVSVVSVMRFYDELKGGTYRTEVIRVGKLRFVFQKVMEAFLSGALVMAATLVIYTLTVCIYGWAHGLPVMAEGISHFEDPARPPSVYVRLIQDGRGMVVYIVKCICVTIYGTIWAVLGSSLTVFISNKRVAVLGPYILKNLMELLGAYLAVWRGVWVFMLNNLQLESCTAAYPFVGVIYEITCPGIITLLSMGIVYAGMERIYRKQG